METSEVPAGGRPTSEDDEPRDERDVTKWTDDERQSISPVWRQITKKRICNDNTGSEDGATCPVCEKQGVKMVAWRCIACRSFWVRLREGQVKLPHCRHDKPVSDCRGCRRWAYEEQFLRRHPNERLQVKPLTKEGRRRDDLYKATRAHQRMLSKVLCERKKKKKMKKEEEERRRN